MSSISELKQQVTQIGQQANSLAGQLAQLSKNIENNIAAVANAIGGTASGEDKNMIAAFQQASQAVGNASASLQAAAQAANNWVAKA